MAWRSKKQTIEFYRTRLQKKAKILNKPKSLQYELISLVDCYKEICILDVGSGPFSTVGTICNGKKIDILACDILADEYNKLMKEQDIIPLVPVQPRDMENLGLYDNLFDIVYCRNALDHTPSPKCALSEMYRVCKPKGWVYLEHYPNNGEKRHRWNINWDKLWKHGMEVWYKDYLPGYISKIEKGMVMTVCQKTFQ